MEANYIVDTVGKFCPVPIVETAHKIKEMNIGETVAVLSDDPGIQSDAPNWCKMTGHEFLGSSENDGIFRIFIRKAVQ